jgi:hypothetical protein
MDTRKHNYFILTGSTDKASHFMNKKTPRFSLYDNGGKTVDRYTLVDHESADIMNGETYMQSTSFSVDFDSPL